MIILKNAHLYSPEDRGINDILICNDKIAKIAPKLDLIYSVADIYDVKGKAIIPGLIDQHVHITGGGGENGFSSRTPEIQLSQCILSGVTTVVGLLGTDSRTRTVSNLVAKTKALNEEGITAYCLTGAYEYPSPFLTNSVADDIVFINEVLGCKIAISDHRCSNITKQDMISLVSQIRIASLISKKPGILHIHVGSANSGIKMILDIIKTSNIPIKHFRPTHIANCIEDAVIFANEGGYIDCSTGRNLEYTADIIIDLLSRVPEKLLTVSSDGNGSLPIWNDKKDIVGMAVAKMDTLMDLIGILTKEKGIDLENILPMFTKNVAEALEIFPQKGCIREGSDGDMVILDDDKKIDSVIAKGKFLMKDGELIAKGTFE